MRQKLLIVTQSLRIPSICTLCKQFHTHRRAVCDLCLEYLEPLGPCCHHCACPLPDASYLICGNCIKHPPQIDSAVVYYRFTDPLRQLVHQFKYQEGLYLSSFLSHLILRSIKEQTVLPECLIPVPMHPQRIKQRGFNQAAVLARLVAKKLQVPYHLDACQKIINTSPQASLDAAQRQKNLRGAFKLIKPIPYEHVALIDDIFTTGATVNELAATLKKSGVKRVDVWCCARAVQQTD